MPTLLDASSNTLPVGRGTDNVPATPAPEGDLGGPQPSRPALTIVVVEDDSSSAHMLGRFLRSMGHEVFAAADGAAAWSLLQRRRVHVVLSDWMLPGMDGLELCRRIRSLSGVPYTYIVLVTARNGSEDRLDGLAAGADDFLAKPFDPRELAARLEVARRLLALQEELERKNEALRAIAATDALTGLHNRRHFDESLQAHLSLASRQGLPLSLVLLDVDHFKSFNDTFGHPSGDCVLREIASILRSESRTHDVVARYGGEEFALLLPATDADDAVALAERLRGAIATARWPLRPVTASLGVATLGPGAATDSDRLVEEADQALYLSKRRGRDRVTHRAEPLPTDLALNQVEV